MREYAKNQKVPKRKPKVTRIGLNWREELVVALLALGITTFFFGVMISIILSLGG